MKRAAMICAFLLLGGLSGCSSSDSTTKTEAPGAAPATTTTTPAPNSKEALETRAQQLDQLASQGNAAAAWEFYSQRCKNVIGNLDSYEIFLEQWRKDRNFQYGGVTVKVNGSSAQVVTVDNDPNAPASSMDPRTWTFIDGQWQFDNC
jgi:hypothetical protein